MAGRSSSDPGLPFGSPHDAARHDSSVPAFTQSRSIIRGGNEENRWEYDRNTQLYTRWWAVTFAGLYFDGHRLRPVRWTLDDIQRTIVDDFAVYKEVWSWVYLD